LVCSAAGLTTARTIPERTGLKAEPAPSQAIADGSNMVAMALANSLSLADLEAMPDDGRRYELIGGAIVMTPAPGPAHQRVSRRLLALLEASMPAGHEAFHAPIDLDLQGDQRVQPDLVVVPTSSVGEKRLSLPVLLVVEIVSAGSGTHDTVTKRAVYAAAGIPAYWIVDPSAAEITALRLDDLGTYQTYGQGQAVALDWPLTVELDITRLAQPPS
jgi:Uma2 family endonuclease